MVISPVMALLERNLGRCPRCMKIAFITAVTSWIVWASCSILWPQTAAVLIALPLAFSALWLTHVTIYAARVFLLLSAEYRTALPAGRIEHPGNPVSRRSFLWVLGTAGGVVAGATIWLPATAFAQGRPCGTGYTCPSDAPNCCSRSKHKCCDGNWACSTKGTCHDSHADARADCGSGQVWACS